MRRVLKPGALLLAIALVAGGVTAAVGLASQAGPSPVLTRHVPLRFVRRADRAFSVMKVAHVSGATAVSGVAALSTAGFTASVSQASNGDICLTTDDEGAGESIACSHLQNAITQGVTLSISGGGIPTRLTVLVPNGVQSVEFQTSAGSVAVPVTNNVATSVAGGLSGDSFTDSLGASQSFTIPTPPALAAVRAALGSN